MTNIGAFNPAFITLNKIDINDGKASKAEPMIIRTEDIYQIKEYENINGVSSAILLFDRTRSKFPETYYFRDRVPEIADKLNISA